VFNVAFEEKGINKDNCDSVKNVMTHDLKYEIAQTKDERRKDYNQMHK
jgi:hypothetical protein